ncbi:shikimate dehydrogenase [Companilactobacillus mishanensis]|uniref:shikimate dehydrogenase n=1 Tax=Companilactobacillus mishanensis TaxID=2486008 RepID=UPI001294DC04|nr:shikimate dehydrogenase [Companilactobacillus mishanensis]MQS89754.1 shikimate dehydrogenase [Companilactobacillus mishanensis]
MEIEKNLYGVIGFPANHSKSPLMQNAAMKDCDINAEYKAFEFAPDKLKKEISKLKQQHISGFNVTMPYKNQILDFLDEIDPMAKKLKSVNTVKRVGDKFIGTSTDGLGFWQTINNSPKNVILIGSGGAARAILAYKPENTNIRIFNRNSERFESHAQQIKSLFNINLEDLAEIDDALPNADLIINATNVGMRDDKSILTQADFNKVTKPAHVVDIIYRDNPTTFLTFARQAGLSAENGLNMLIAQGALSFEVWFNKTAPIDLMTKMVKK